MKVLHFFEGTGKKLMYTGGREFFCGQQIFMLADNNDNEMDGLFKVAFESVDKCRRALDKMHPGTDISTPTPAAEKCTGSVPQREGGP